MNDKEVEACRAAIAALEGQRAVLGVTVVEMACAPLRDRLAGLLRPAGLQRRQVTVLFADVVGSTAITQRLDAEETLHLLSGALRRMAALVQAHQGRVLRFTGDGVKAAFGMDEAREDDAERAVRAGLAILSAGREQAEAAQRSHGIADFAVRVGVHTGDVALGAGVEADNTAMGAAVNIAARMEQSAPAGALRISHDTWGQVRGLFALDAQPPLQVKGVDAPMLTYLVRAALGHSFAGVERGLQGLTSPMVGRHAELQRLLDAVARARQARHLQALTVLGDAGLGKSRLLRELIAALTATGSATAPAAPVADRPVDKTADLTAELTGSVTAVLSGCRLLTVRSQPDGMLRPWGLLRSLLATQFSVADTDSAALARDKVVAGLSPWFEQHGERQAQLIGQLSGLDFGANSHVQGLDPRSLRDQALAAFLAYLQALAAKGQALPVLIIEDLHWADDSSLDLLQHLLAHAAALPLALVMSCRPALLTRRPEWGTADTRVQLGPLAAAQSDELAQSLLQRMGEVPAKLTELIVGQAEGNPYYMEELVRRLVDDGVITVDSSRDGTRNGALDSANSPARWTLHEDRLQRLRLPSTLVGLLQARLDALPASERLAARQASVIGYVFWDDALQAVDSHAAHALPALQQAAFVRLHEASDFEGTAERQFDHHLLHQVTYDTLLKAERSGGHGAVARWLTARTQGRGSEFLAMTGDHAERAGETALAVDCFEHAGKEAQKRFANAVAQAWLRRAVNLLDESQPQRRVDLLTHLEEIADLVGDRPGQDALHAEVAALLARHPEPVRQSRLWFGMALLADRRGDSAAAERLSHQAFDLAQGCDAAQWAALAQGQLTWLHLARRDYQGAARHIEIGLPWAAKIEAETTRAETEAKLLTLSAMASMLRCRLDEARGTLRAVLSRGEALGKPRLQLGALDNLALVASYLGRWHEVAAWGERMRALADSIGSPREVAGGQLRLAEAAEGLGDFAGAIGWHTQSLAMHRSTGNRRMEAITLRFLAGLHLQQGAAELGALCCAQAQTLLQALDEPLETCEVDAKAAFCELGLGRPLAALDGVNQTLEQLKHNLAESPAHETIELRWACHSVLEPLGDERAAPLLQQLFADVQARVSQATDLADRERMIQDLPVLRAIVAAQGGR